MKIESRYSDIPEVSIDESKVPVEFRHLIPLAREWCIGDDVELDAYIEAASEEKRRQFLESFRPHFKALAKWSRDSAHLVPQPDEHVLFEMAANAAATVGSAL